MDGLIALAGFAVGFLVGLTGVGGGALMTPLLIFGFGIAPALAVGTDLFYAALTKLGGVCAHARQSSVDWPVVARLACGSLPAAGLTLLILGQLGDEPAHLEGVITITLGVALMVSAVALLIRPVLRPVLKQVLPKRFSGLTRQLSAQWQVRLTVLVGAVVGALVTLTSVGAGAMGAAALFWLYPRMSAVRVVGTDIAHAVPLAALAGIGHWQLGHVDFALLGALLLGSLPGIFLGSRFSQWLPERWLRTGLATLLILIGFRLVA